ncbi:MAG: ribonuclease III [Alphaproteobacteria bacterium]|nr:ribonuclease III [Alphaproteobacteria bacterium]
MNNLEQRLDYIFRDKNLLIQALTHSSVTADIHRNYERLEFLGDRILGVMVADMLCRTFVDEPEGNLARRFVQLVCKETVAEVVRQLDIIPFIRVANDEVRDKDNVLCDVGEALIAAIYIDSQSLETARNFVERWWKPLIDKKSQPPKDYKTLLQEVAAQRKLDVPSYAIIDKKGPEHAPQFEVSVMLGQGYIAHGIGSSKKHAEQEAAHALLKTLGAIDE